MATQSADTILEVAASLGIPIADAYRDGVISNFEKLLQQAALVMAAAVPEAMDNSLDFQP